MFTLCDPCGTTRLADIMKGIVGYVGCLESKVDNLKGEANKLQASFEERSSSYKKELRDIKGELEDMKKDKKIFSIICYLSLFINVFVLFIIL